MTKETTLQWVHSPITVVMRTRPLRFGRLQTPLQWVHSPITVVMDVLPGHLYLYNRGFNGSTVR